MYVLRQSNQVLTVSEQGRNQVLEALHLSDDSERVKVVTTSVNTKLFYPRDRIAGRQRMNIPPDVPVVIFAGRLEYAKNLPLLILAFGRTIKTLPNAMLVLAGDGSKRSELQSLANSIGIHEHVLFLGRVEHDQDLPLILNCGNVFAMSTITGEGAPCAALEALACGLPIVSLSSGELGKIVIKGQTGKLVQSPDLEVFAQTLIEVIRLSDAMRDACVAMANLYEANTVAERLSELLANSAKFMRRS